ncbi:hypothetical protein B9Z55_011348 [Caenorhabditis nigoni]|uniref:Uncharacterized protein n=1 Tax=Caenorhabditis nigoni TaxID=1611254 RepID=A0A2G5UJR4_9PELO|nr:hypothetical protein B9Z55_011348 [Caenorhabditis nigoni]
MSMDIREFIENNEAMTCWTAAYVFVYVWANFLGCPAVFGLITTLFYLASMISDERITVLPMERKLRILLYCTWGLLFVMALNYFTLFCEPVENDKFSSHLAIFYAVFVGLKLREYAHEIREREG